MFYYIPINLVKKGNSNFVIFNSCGIINLPDVAIKKTAAITISKIILSKDHILLFL